MALLLTATAPGHALYFYVGGGPIGLPFASDAAAPACDGAGILSRIRERFASAHAWTWRTGLTISAIEWAGDSRPGGEYPSLIGRRYCEARAVISTGQPSPVYYLIETHQGFAGVGTRVTFCLPGYDPWRIYDASCRTVRPL